nr:hypothetical protein [Tanacetum cinerariifolium]
MARFTRESKPKSFSHNSTPKEPLHVNSKPKEPVHGFGYTPLLAKVVKGNEAQECLDTPMMVLERGSLNYGGNHVLVGCVKKFKILPDIHNVCFSKGFNRVKISCLGGHSVLLEFKSLQSFKKYQKYNGINSWFSSLKQWNAQFEIPDRVVWIDVEGTPLQAWSHVTFNGISCKWGELVYMDESNSSNKESVSAKEVIGWVLDFGEDDIAQSEDGSDNNSNSPNHVENSPMKMENFLDHVKSFDVHVDTSPDHVENSLIHVKNSTKQMENSPEHVENPSFHVENSPVYLENSPDLSGTLLVAHEGISSLGTIESIPRNMSPSGFKHDHVDSLAPSPKPMNGFSILERFQEFISIGQAMGFDKHASKISKLNHFLVSDRLLDLFPNLSGLILHRHISNQKTIILKESHMGYGPIPFRLFYSWFLKQDFAYIVEDSWNNDGVHASNAMILLKNKLKSLKKVLKRRVFKRRVSRSMIVEFSKTIYLRLTHVLTKEMVFLTTCQIMQSLFHDIGVIDRKISIDMAQKAKVKWAIKVDKNSNFFHGIVNKKEVNKPIKGILVDGEWVDNPVCVKREFTTILRTDSLLLIGLGKEQDLLFKVDFQKAFDSVRWDHLVDILGKFGFSSEWRGWICCFPHSSKASVLNIQSMANSFGYLENNIPFTYIGVKVAANMAHINSWNEVIQKVTIKLSKWKAKSLLAEMDDCKMTWVCWRKAMAKKQYDGLGVSGLASSKLFTYLMALLISLPGHVPVVLFGSRFIEQSIVLNLRVWIFWGSARKRPRGAIEESQFHELSLLLSSVVLSSFSDRGSWTLNGHGDFRLNLLGKR